MSTYSSATDLHDLWESPYRIDVASDCMGVDVRLLVDNRSAYLDPDDARRVAAALVKAADETEAWRADSKHGVVPTTAPSTTDPATQEAAHG